MASAQHEESNRLDSVRFGPFEFDHRSLDLRKNGHPVRLSPLPSRALARLLESPGDLVPREVLVEVLWEDPPSDPDRSLNFAIRQVRTALGDDASRPAYVETVPRKGYRFVAPAQSETTPARAPSPRRRGGSRRWIAVAAALAVSAALVSTAIARRGGDTPPVARLAVLPLERLGGSPSDARFAAGLRDELVAGLARLPADRLAVIARSSSDRLAGATLDSLAAVADADYVLRGSVTGEGGAVRVVFELVSTVDGQVVWADRFRQVRPLSMELERQVADRVVAAILPDVAPSSGWRAARVPDSARDLYLQAMHLLRTGGRPGAPDPLDKLEEAIALAPDYAAARAALGSELLRRGDVSGRAELEQAVQLDPAVPGGLEALADDDLYRKWDVPRAAERYRLAVEARPGDPGPYHRRAYLLSLQGRHDAALASVRQALRLDPVSPFVTGDVGRLYYRAGRFEEAERYCARALELGGDPFASRSCLLNLRLLAGDSEAAREHGEALLRMMGADTGLLKRFQDAEAPSAMDLYWRWQADRLTVVAERDPDQWIRVAQAHVWLGQHEEALAALEEARRRHSEVLPLVAGDPCFAPLFSDPRYRLLFARSGLPLSPPPRLG